jgi:hypothetical protein
MFSSDPFFKLQANAIFSKTGKTYHFFLNFNYMSKKIKLFLCLTN